MISMIRRRSSAREPREFAGRAVRIQAVHAVVDQPVDVPAQFGFVDLAAGIKRHDVGGENALQTIRGRHREADFVRREVGNWRDFGKPRKHCLSLARDGGLGRGGKPCSAGTARGSLPRKWPVRALPFGAARRESRFVSRAAPSTCLVVCLTVGGWASSRRLLKFLNPSSKGSSPYDHAQPPCSLKIARRKRRRRCGPLGAGRRDEPLGRLAVRWPAWPAI